MSGAYVNRGSCGRLRPAASCDYDDDALEIELIVPHDAAAAAAAEAAANKKNALRVAKYNIPSCNDSPSKCLTPPFATAVRKFVLF